VAKSGETTLILDRDVALVLFDFLARVADEEEGEPLAEALANEAELPALWSLLAELEEALTEPSDENYMRLVAEARTRVMKKFGRKR
jgi:hypothetical protein